MRWWSACDSTDGVFVYVPGVGWVAFDSAYTWDRKLQTEIHSNMSPLNVRAKQSSRWLRHAVACWSKQCLTGQEKFSHIPGGRLRYMLECLGVPPTCGDRHCSTHAFLGADAFLEEAFDEHINLLFLTPDRLDRCWTDLPTVLHLK
jgi:hypothetical protein